MRALLKVHIKQGFLAGSFLNVYLSNVLGFGKVIVLGALYHAAGLYSFLKPFLRRCAANDCVCLARPSTPIPPLLCSLLLFGCRYINAGEFIFIGHDRRQHGIQHDGIFQLAQAAVYVLHLRNSTLKMSVFHMTYGGMISPGSRAAL